MLGFAPKSDNKMTYDDAVLYCHFLEHDDHRDWRMPTMSEYIELYIGQVGWFKHASLPEPDLIRFVYPVRDIC